MQILVYYLEYTVLGRVTNFPFKDQITHSSFLGYSSVSDPLRDLCDSVYLYRSEKVQYLVSILVSQNIAAVFLYISGLFLLGESQEISEKSLLTFTMVTLSLGVLLFVATVIRFSVLLRKGKYRKGSKRDELRAKFEKENIYSGSNYRKYRTCVYRSIYCENVQFGGY